MKLLLASLLLFATSAHALQADRFKCTLTVQDPKSGQSTQQTQVFDLARTSMSASPSPGVFLTTAQTTMNLRLNQKDSFVNTFVNFYYKHALKDEGGGKPLQARQYLWIGISMAHCPTGADPKQCGSVDSDMNIPETKDPFDPVNGWTPTTVIEGTPMFNERMLGPATAEIVSGPNRAVANFDCKYQGTYW